MESLHWELCHVKDPRGSNKSIGIGPILSIFTIAVAAGAKDLKEANAFAKRLTNAQLKELGCPKAKDALGNIVDGKFVDEVVGLVSVVDAESGDVVAVALKLHPAKLVRIMMKGGLQ